MAHVGCRKEFNHHELNDLLRELGLIRGSFGTLSVKTE